MLLSGGKILEELVEEELIKTVILVSQIGHNQRQIAKFIGISLGVVNRELNYFEQYRCFSRPNNLYLD